MQSEVPYSSSMGHDMAPPSKAYRSYVLFVLTLVYTFNFVDRQIITIVAPYVKADLQLSDAQLGLLYGTAFALFYGLFGIALAKLADGWNRVKALALGLGFWSLMTTVSGAASNFGQLGAARVGVGIGEASSSPAAISLLGDYFPKKSRATALAFYSIGVYLGAGISMMLGGIIIGAWDRAYPDPLDAPFGLTGWKAAFIGVGIPGVFLAILVLTTVRERVRGALDGHIFEGERHPFRAVLREFATMMPVSNLFQLKALAAPAREYRRAIVAFIICVVLSCLMIYSTDQLLAPGRRGVVGTIGDFQITTNTVQWITIGIAAYASFSWVQSIRMRDPPTYALIAGSPVFLVMVLSAGMVNWCLYSVNAFVFLYGTRYLGLTAEDGFTLGAIAATMGGTGVVCGGFAGDWVKRVHPAGRIFFIMSIFTLFCIGTFVQYTSEDTTTFYIAFAFATFWLTTWFGGLQATFQDLVLPRMRGLAFAVMSLGLNVIGLGLGPYVVGLISDITGNLRIAILSILLMWPLAMIGFFYVSRRIADAEATLIERARAAGEPI